MAGRLESKFQINPSYILGLIYKKYRLILKNSIHFCKWVSIRWSYLLLLIAIIAILVYLVWIIFNKFAGLNYLLGETLNFFFNIFLDGAKVIDNLSKAVMDPSVELYSEYNKLWGNFYNENFKLLGNFYNENLKLLGNYYYYENLKLLNLYFAQHHPSQGQILIQSNCQDINNINLLIGVFHYYNSIILINNNYNITDYSNILAKLDDYTFYYITQDKLLIKLISGEYLKYNYQYLIDGVIGNNLAWRIDSLDKYKYLIDLVNSNNIQFLAWINDLFYSNVFFIGKYYLYKEMENIDNILYVTMWISLNIYIFIFI